MGWCDCCSSSPHSPNNNPDSNNDDSEVCIHHINVATIAKCFAAATACSQIFMVSFCFTQNEGDMDDGLAQEESNMLFSVDDIPDV